MRGDEPVSDAAGGDLTRATPPADGDDPVGFAKARASNSLLMAIVHAQALSIAGADPRPAFERMLGAVLTLTHSAHGFVAEALAEVPDPPHFRVEAIGHLGPEDEQRLRFAQWAACACMPGWLVDALMTTRAPIVANGQHALCLEGQAVPTNFIALPLSHDGEIVGLAGLAEREDGYDEGIAAFLEPFLVACASVIVGARKTRQRQFEQRERDNLFALAQGSGDLIGWADLDGAVRYLNPAGRRLIGLAPEESINGLRIADCHTAHTNRTLVEAVLPEVRERGQWEGELEFLNRTTKSAILARQEIFLLRDPVGMPQGFATIARDITEFKRVANALRLSEEKFATAFHTAPDAFGISRLSDGCYLDLNEGFWRVTGWTRQEAIGKTSLDLGIWRDPGDRTRLVERLTRDGEVRNLEVQLRRRNGEVFSALISATPIRVAGEACVLTAARDITDRIQMEQALRESEARYREAQRIAHLGHWDFEIASGKMRWSEEIFRLFGLSETQPEPDYDGYLELVHPADRDALVAAVEAAKRDSKPYTVEHRVRLPDGTYRYVEGRGIAHRGNSGRIERLSGTVMDITERKLNELALRGSERELADAQRMAGIGRWELSLETSSLAWSEGIYDLFEIDRSQFGASYDFFMAAVHPEDRDAVAQAYWTSVDNRMPYEIVHRLLMRDGRIKWVHERCRTEYDDNGRPLRSVGTVQDVTASHQAQEAIRLSEQRYRTIFDTAAVSLWEEDYSAVKALVDQLRAAGIADLRAHLVAHPEVTRAAFSRLRVCDVNPAALRLYAAVDKEDLLGSLDRIAVPATYEIFRDELAALFEGSAQFEAEVETRTLTGETRHVLLNVNFPIDGAFNRVLVSRLDITERKRAEAAARESEKRWQIATEGAGIGIFDWNVATGEVFFSARWKSMLGYDANELSHEFATWERLCHPQDLPRAMQEVAAHLAGNTPIYVCAHRLLAKDGSYRWVEARAQIMERDAQGNPLRMLGTHTDIHQAKVDQEALSDLNATLEARVQAELARNRQKDHLLIQQSRLAAMGEMIGNIAHQWRQPINALGLLLSNLKDAYEFGELTKEYVDAQVERGNKLIQSMSTTIEDFRSFFRPNRTTQAFRLQTTVENALAIVESAYEHHNIRIEVSIADDVMVAGFANEYTQVLLNLLANAKEAIEARQARGGIVSIFVEQQGSSARLRVRDNGGGIPDDILPRIFDPYFTTRESGTGIGLYMSKMIIETNMNGRIEVRNVAGGAEVSILTPIAEHERPQSRACSIHPTTRYSRCPQ